MNAKRAQATKKKKKGDRSFISILVIVLVAGAAILGYVVFKPKPAATVLAPDAPLPAPKGYVIGSDTAPVEIIEFGDFECPGCGQFAVVTAPDVKKRLVETGAARFRFVDFPIISIHPAALSAHNAAACANDQQKFWEMHDRIFMGQPEWSWAANGRNMNAPRIFKRYARELGLDGAAFDQCLDSRRFEPQIMANVKEGERSRVGGTPTFFVGNQILNDVSYDAIKKAVDVATAEARKAPAAVKTFGDTAR